MFHEFVLSLLLELARLIEIVERQENIEMAAPADHHHDERPHGETIAVQPIVNAIDVDTLAWFRRPIISQAEPPPIETMQPIVISPALWTPEASRGVRPIISQAELPPMEAV